VAGRRADRRVEARAAPRVRRCGPRESFGSTRRSMPGPAVRRDARNHGPVVAGCRRRTRAARPPPVARGGARHAIAAATPRRSPSAVAGQAILRCNDQSRTSWPGDWLLVANPRRRDIDAYTESATPRSLATLAVSTAWHSRLPNQRLRTPRRATGTPTNTRLPLRTGDVSSVSTRRPPPRPTVSLRRGRGPIESS